MDSVLRPRDIQTRIRAGESPEAVAEAARTTVEKIMPFAGPVMAERAHIADLAQRASVRRRVGAGPIGALGEAVAASMEQRDLDAAAVDWDAWRREDGRWIVTARFGAGAGVEEARFVYDVAGRYVVADDDTGRLLVGERHGVAQSAGVVTPGTPEQPLSTVEFEHTRQIALGDDAIALVTGSRPPESTDAPAAATTGADPVDAVAASVTDPAPAADLELDLDLPAPPRTPVRGSRPVRAPESRGRVVAPVPEEPVASGDDSLTEDLTEAASALRDGVLPGSVDSADADWIVTQASERAPSSRATGAAAPAAAPAAAEAPVEAPAAAAPAPQAPPAAQSSAAATVASPTSAGEPDGDDARPVPPPRKGKGKARASVPSWDEIMFGSPTNE